MQFFDLESRFYLGRAIANAALMAVIVARPWFITNHQSPHISSSYEAISHLLVGGFIGAMILGGRRWDGFWWAFGWVAIASTVEVTCAVVTITQRN